MLSSSPVAVRQSPCWLSWCVCVVVVRTWRGVWRVCKCAGSVLGFAAVKRLGPGLGSMHTVLIRARARISSSLSRKGSDLA